MIISIDGKAKAGKSTLISDLVKKTEWPVLYVGDMYRTVALTSLENPEKDVGTIVNEFCSEFIFTGKPSGIQRNAELETAATTLSQNPEVSDKLKNMHKKIVSEHLEQGKNLILDGSHGNNFIHPEYLCFFVTAIDETRLNRLRCDEYGYVGRASKTFKFEESVESLKKRDEIDKISAPWRYAPVDGAIEIDTTGTAYGHSIEIALIAVTNRLNELSLKHEFKDNVLTIIPKAYLSDDKSNNPSNGSISSCNCG